MHAYIHTYTHVLGNACTHVYTDTLPGWQDGVFEVTVEIWILGDRK